MTPDFESHKNDRLSSLGDSPAGNLGTLDMQKRDRFELLSAYLDGEVSSQERRQVEEWLATDAQVQSLYKRLLKLRQVIRTMPVPAGEQPVQETVTQVFKRLNRRRQQMLVWGGGAIAATLVASLSGIFGGGNAWGPQFAQTPIPTAEAEPLAIALNQPIIEIPKAAIANPVKPLGNSSSYYNPAK